jgi:uncharacterized membrane protein YjjP (DUF1212 family)
MLSETADHKAIDNRIVFLLRLGEALHLAGYATYRLEAELDWVAERLGMLGQFFTTPTSIFASFGADGAQRTFMMRVEPAGPDLGRMVRVTEIAHAVAERRIKPQEGSLELQAIKDAKPPYGLLTMTLAYVLASASAARLLGGGLMEIAVAGGAGLLTGLLAALARRLSALGRVFEPVAACGCALVAGLLGARWPVYSVPIVTLAGLIVLIPGLTLTTAIAELAMRHLASGTARLSSAFVTFIAIGLGVALGTALASRAIAPAPLVSPVGLPGWTLWPALLASAIAFTVLLGADRRDARWIIAAGAVAFLGSILGAQLFGPELGVFVGAFAVAAGANLWSRVTGRPAAVLQVPGLLVLVPGSIGFRSIAALLESQVVSGIGTGFSMLLTAAALVIGLTSANAVVPERDLP